MWLSLDLRCVLEVGLRAFVTLAGMILMLQWYAGNSGTTLMEVSAINCHTHHFISLYMCTLNTLSDATMLTELAFSPGQEEIYGIQGVMCNGTEDRLGECQYSTAISAECSNGDHVAGVRCVGGMLGVKVCVCVCVCVSVWPPIL